MIATIYLILIFIGVIFFIFKGVATMRLGQVIGGIGYVTGLLYIIGSILYAYSSYQFYHTHHSSSLFVFSMIIIVVGMILDTFGALKLKRLSSQSEKQDTVATNVGGIIGQIIGFIITFVIANFLFK